MPTVAPKEAKALLTEAQRALEAGQFEDAKRVIEDAYAQHPHDEKVLELYQQILLADGVRLSRRARDLRRDGIKALDKRDRASFSDGEDVRAAFERSIESFDKILAANPENSKALMLKAGALDRMDREGMGEEVSALFERALELHPDNEEILYARSRIMGACQHCGGSGFCGECKGSGEVSAVFMRGACPACKGSGVCTHCGLF